MKEFQGPNRPHQPHYPPHTWNRVYHAWRYNHGTFPVTTAGMYQCRIVDARWNTCEGNEYLVETVDTDLDRLVARGERLWIAEGSIVPDAVVAAHSLAKAD